MSPRQLSEPTFADVVECIIEEAGLPPWRMCLEVTESALMEVDAATEVLHRLKRVGVQIAIDDFGTGYSSLSRLRGFPVDYIKIDRGSRGRSGLPLGCCRSPREGLCGGVLAGVGQAAPATASQDRCRRVGNEVLIALRSG